MADLNILAIRLADARQHVLVCTDRVTEAQKALGDARQALATEEARFDVAVREIRGNSAPPAEPSAPLPTAAEMEAALIPASAEPPKYTMPLNSPALGGTAAQRPAGGVRIVSGATVDGDIDPDANRGDKTGV